MALWLSRSHFDLRDPWEHVDFQVRATYDVVGASGWRIKAQVQPASEIWIVREGDVEIRLGSRSAIAKAPCVALLTAGEARDTQHVAGKQLSILGFSFDASFLGVIDFMRVLPLATVSPPLPTLEPLIKRMVCESRDGQAGYSLAVHGLGQLALVELLRAQACDDAPLVRQTMCLASIPELGIALQLITTRFDEPLDTNQLARAVHLSPKHLSRKFQAALGLTPTEYLRSYRLNRARDLLLSSDMAVATVANRVGFESAAHFTRAFKAAFHITPTAWRHSVRLVGKEQKPVF